MLAYRYATLDDAAAAGALIDAMDVHYRGAGNTRGPEAAAGMIRRTIKQQEGGRFLLALDGETPAGIASFTILRPGTMLSGVLFLNDLFVLAHLRGRGIGRGLMRELAAWAMAHDIGCIDLTTHDSNARARALYASLGGALQPKVMFRFDAAALEQLAKTGSPEIPQ
jgi:GNAT superfamily N-acetyltransferase